MARPARTLDRDAHASTRPGAGTAGPLGDLGPPRAVTPLPDSIAVSVPDSVRVRSGYQHWRKAALGGAIGGALGALTGAVGAGISSCDDCRRQPSAGSGALYGGLIGAGAGGVIGFLMGLSSPKYTWVPSAEAPPGEGPSR